MKKFLWKNLAIGLGIMLIPTLCLSEEMVFSSDYIEEKNCLRTKPFLKLPKTNTNYYYPKLTKLEWLNRSSAPVAPERDEFPYETICEEISDPACDIFKVIHERDSIAQKWNTSEIVQYWSNYFLDIDTQNENNETKNKKDEKFQGSEIMDKIRALSGIKRELDHFVDSGILDADGREIIRIPYIYSQFEPKTPFQKKSMSYFLTLPDFYTKENLTEWEQERNETIERLKKIKKENDKLIEVNQEIERKNEETMKVFYDFYTPSKLNQLLNDYDDLLKSNCSEKMPIESEIK